MKNHSLRMVVLKLRNLPTALSSTDSSQSLIQDKLIDLHIMYYILILGAKVL